MRILEINSVCGKGSTGKIAVGIYNVLKEQGHECKIAYGRDEAVGIPQEDTIKIGNKLGIMMHLIGSRIFDKSGFYSKHATRKLIKEIDRYNPDIIQIHNIHGYYINVELLFKYIQRKNKKVVWTLHDCWPFTGHCAFFEYGNCEKWKTLCSDCQFSHAYPKSILDNSSKNYKNKKKLFVETEQISFIVPSKWLEGLVKKSFLAKYPTHVVYNGIDLKNFCNDQGDIRQKYGLGDKKIILGVANIWDARKGMEDMIFLANMLDKEVYQVVIVGRRLNNPQNIPENITLIDFTESQKELAQLYSAAFAFVNPTYEDNFPTVNIEALACGTPVITYNTGGSPEAVDETCGIVTAERTPVELKRAIDYLEKNPLNSEDCQKRSKLFDQFMRYGDYIDLYKSVM